MLKVRSKTVSLDPQQIEATATMTDANGVIVLEASYLGNADELLKDIKSGALLELQYKAKRHGIRLS